MFNNEEENNAIESGIEEPEIENNLKNLKEKLVELGTVKSDYEESIKDSSKELESVNSEIEKANKILADFPDLKEINKSIISTTEELDNINNNIKDVKSEYAKLLIELNDNGSKNEILKKDILSNDNIEKQLTISITDLNKEIKSASDKLEEIGLIEFKKIKQEEKRLIEFIENVNKKKVKYLDELELIDNQKKEAANDLEKINKNIDKAENEKVSVDASLENRKKEYEIALKKLEELEKTEYTEKLKEIEQREGLVSNRESYLEDKIKALKTIKKSLEKTYGKPLNNIKL